MFDNSFPACAFVFFVFVFKVEISSCKLIPLLKWGSVLSGSESWDNCDWVFPDELHVSSVPDRSPLCLDSGIVTSLWLYGSRVYACWGVTCHLHFWQNDRDLLCATAVTQGWNGHWVRVSTQSWLWRRKFSCCSCWDSNLLPFNHESDALTNKLFWLPQRETYKHTHTHSCTNTHEVHSHTNSHACTHMHSHTHTHTHTQCMHMKNDIHVHTHTHAQVTNQNVQSTLFIIQHTSQRMTTTTRPHSKHKCYQNVLLFIIWKKI